MDGKEHEYERWEHALQLLTLQHQEVGLTKIEASGQGGFAVELVMVWCFVVGETCLSSSSKTYVGVPMPTQRRRWGDQ